MWFQFSGSQTQFESKSPWGLVETQIAEPTFRVSDSVDFRNGLKTGISKGSQVLLMLLFCSPFFENQRST